MKQYAAIDDVVYFWFAGNDTSGSGGDGASPAADVRLAGAAADAAPTYSPTPTLLSHVNYPAGAYEIAITASAANGFAADSTYAVFCTLAIDSQNPTGFVGSFDTKPVTSNMTDWENGERLDLILDIIAVDVAGLDGAAMRGTNSAALAATALTDVTWTDAKAAFLDASIQTVDTVVDTIVGDTNELQTDWANGGRLDLLLDACALEATVGALNDLSAANVNSEVADVLKTDTTAEMSAGAPPASPTIEQMINYIYRLFRNKTLTTSSLLTVRNDADSADLFKATISDDSTTFTKEEYVTG